MKNLFVSLLFFCSSVFADCSQLVAWGYPVAPNSIALCQIAYYTEWDPFTKNPAYSAELLLEENVSGTEPRKGVFKPHPNINSNLQASNEDYFKSGYDRGHLAPSADMRKDSAAMAQSFYLTNMVPQYPVLNRNYWANLERIVRNKVTTERPIYVITGPIYEGPPKTIGDNLWIPSFTFKIIYDKTTNTIASYIMPNELTISGKLSDFYVPLEKVESMTKMSYFPEMPSAVRDNLKQIPLELAW